MKTAAGPCLRFRRSFCGSRGYRTGYSRGEEPVLHLIEPIVGPLGLRVDQASPWVDARPRMGPGSTRIVPPLSLRGRLHRLRSVQALSGTNRT